MLDSRWNEHSKEKVQMLKPFAPRLGPDQHSAPQERLHICKSQLEGNILEEGGGILEPWLEAIRVAGARPCRKAGLSLGRVLTKAKIGRRRKQDPEYRYLKLGGNLNTYL